MKRILFLLSVVLIATIANSQTVNISVPFDNTFYTYTGVTGDTIKNTTTSVTKYISVKKPFLYGYHVAVNVDSLAGGNKPTTWVLSGANRINGAFTTIASYTTHLTRSDTTINYTSVSTPLQWRYLKLVGTGGHSTSKARIGYIDINVPQY